MALPISIESLLDGREVESSRIEYKKAWNPQECIRTICAFANDIENNDGGYIILGVEESDGFPACVSGIEPKRIEAIEKDLLNKCHFIEPFIFPRVEVCLYKGKSLVVLSVSAGDGRPYKASRDVFKDQSDKAYFIRHGSMTIQADGNLLRELFENSSRIPFDDRENPFASLSDLDESLMRMHLSRVKSNMLEGDESLQMNQIAHSMKLLCGPSENRHPRNIALLMFSRRINDFFPYAVIETLDLPDRTGMGMTEKSFSGPIQNQLESALQFIGNQWIEERVIKQESRIETLRFFNYPIIAVKEILANAVYHRDYQINEPITVVKTPTFIEIKSFPGLDRSITDRMIADLDIRSFGEYRNRRIGNYLKELGLTEGRNTGIPAAVRALKKNGSGSPMFITDSQRQSLTVRIPIHSGFLSGKTEENHHSGRKNRTRDDIEREVLVILSSGAMSQRGIARSLGYASVSAGLRYVMDNLEEKGMIVSEGNCRSSVYCLSCKQ